MSNIQSRLIVKMFHMLNRRDTASLGGKYSMIHARTRVNRQGPSTAKKENDWTCKKATPECRTANGGL